MKIKVVIIIRIIIINITIIIIIIISDHKRVNQRQHCWEKHSQPGRSYLWSAWISIWYTVLVEQKCLDFILLLIFLSFTSMAIIYCLNSQREQRTAKYFYSFHFWRIYYITQFTSNRDLILVQIPKLQPGIYWYLVWSTDKFRGGRLYC